MAEKIDGSGNAEINNIKFAQQASHPSSPSSGHELLYMMSGTAHGGLFVKTSDGKQIGPFITGTSSGGGGAPTDAKYVTTASDGSLSNEIVIPCLAASPDVPGVGAGGMSYDFDTATDPFTWSPSSPTVIDANTSLLSHYYIKSTDNTQRYMQLAWTPAGAFDLRCKIMWASETTATSGNELYWGVVDSTRSNRAVINLYTNGANFTVGAYTYAGSYVSRGAWTVTINELYLRITRDGSDNISWYFSHNGNLWQRLGTAAVAFAMTVSHFEMLITPAGVDSYYAIDWLRSDV